MNHQNDFFSNIVSDLIIPKTVNVEWFGLEWVRSIQYQEFWKWKTDSIFTIELTYTGEVMKVVKNLKDGKNC